MGCQVFVANKTEILQDEYKKNNDKSGFVCTMYMNDVQIVFLSSKSISSCPCEVSKVKANDFARSRFFKFAGEESLL